MTVEERLNELEERMNKLEEQSKIEHARLRKKLSTLEKDFGLVEKVTAGNLGGLLGGTFAVSLALRGKLK